ncbi:MAG: hypothetical protein ACMXYL_05590 [Candidatus Woesearchaeota archaeon]
MPQKKKSDKKTVEGEKHTIGHEISSGVRSLFDTVKSRIVSELKIASERAGKDISRLGASLFFFMLGTVFVAIGLVKFFEYYVHIDASMAYALVGIILLVVSLGIRKPRSNK